MQVLSSVPRRVSLSGSASGSTISPVSCVGPVTCFDQRVSHTCVQVGAMLRKGSFSEVSAEKEKPKSYHSCAVSAKEPRLLVKELQRMFGENKLLLRASGPSFVKGDKNKTRFDIVIYKASSCRDVWCCDFGNLKTLPVFFLSV
jgi:hypothetical protein